MDKVCNLVYLIMIYYNKNHRKYILIHVIFKNLEFYKLFKNFYKNYNTNWKDSKNEVTEETKL